MTTRSREEILELWLQTLEKHPERQTKAQLGVRLSNGEERFCCLGQLCDIFYETSFKVVKEDGEIQYEEYDLFLPLQVEQYMKFNGEVGPINCEEEDLPHKNGVTCNSLAEMNDEGFTWPEIAAFIRANPDKVFVS